MSVLFCCRPVSDSRGLEAAGWSWGLTLLHPCPQEIINQSQEPHNGHSPPEASPVGPHCLWEKVKLTSPAPTPLRDASAEMVSIQPAGHSQQAHPLLSPLFILMSTLTPCFLLLKALFMFPVLLQPSFPALGDPSSSRGLTVFLPL